MCVFVGGASVQTGNTGLSSGGKSVEMSGKWSVAALITVGCVLSY